MKILYLIPIKIILIILFLFSSAITNSQEINDTTIDYAPFSDNTNHWYSIADKHNIINALPNRPRYKPTEITAIGDNMLLFQKKNGGWPKNYDFFAILTSEQRKLVEVSKSETNTTFDNGNTYTQIAALAIAYKVTNSDKYKNGCLNGLNFILSSQYNNGGWPQFYPIEINNYSSHITYNDDVMLGIMKLLKDILDGNDQYSFVDFNLKKKLQLAYNKGLDCILKTQIIDNGKPTAWCQQYDEITLKPAWARKFEPPCICNKESAGLVLFLMSIEHPTKEIINAVNNAVDWFEESKIYNTRIATVSAAKTITAYKVSVSDKVVVIASTAKPIWTRYYELKTHRPMFCNRDSKVVYSLSEVARERRDGYSWYNYAPEEVLKKYKKWLEKISNL